METSPRDSPHSEHPPSFGSSPRDRFVVVLVSVLALTFALSSVTLSNVLPPGSQCHPALNDSRSIDAQRYCFAIVPWPSGPVNYTEWGYAFQVTRAPLSYLGVLVAIHEPQNRTSYGGIECIFPNCSAPGEFFVCNYSPQWGYLTTCYSPANESSPGWFIPDHQAGVMFSIPRPSEAFTNLTLLVQV